MKLKRTFEERECRPIDYLAVVTRAKFFVGRKEQSEKMKVKLLWPFSTGKLAGNHINEDTSVSLNEVTRGGQRGKFGPEDLLLLPHIDFR